MGQDGFMWVKVDDLCVVVDVRVLAEKERSIGSIQRQTGCW